MFPANGGHLQWGLFDTCLELLEKLRKRLGTSWADTFYQVFCHIDETPFALLYTGEPYTFVNVLAGAEILTAGYGWSDEELYDAVQFKLPCLNPIGKAPPDSTATV